MGGEEEKGVVSADWVLSTKEDGVNKNGIGNCEHDDVDCGLNDL